MSKLIYFDAGHGGSDPGAVKYEKEADLTIKVVKYACAYLKDHYNVEVFQDISADSLNTITARANKKKAALFVSVHFNAGRGDGYEALVYSSANKKLGQHFEKYVNAVGQNSRGVKYRPDLAVLRDTNMKAILNEIAFVDNWDDIQDWNDNSELKKMGEALAKAAATWVGAKKKTASKPSTGSSDIVDVKDFIVKVKYDELNIRSTPKVVSGNIIGSIKDKGSYTIVKTTKDGKWGLLKAGPKPGSSWICIDSEYVKKVTTSTTPKKTLKKGAKVRIKSGAKDLNTGDKYASYVYKTTYTVIELSGSRVVFGLNGIITGAVSKSNVTVV